MDSLKWINSSGGPLILISGKSYKKWSGVYKRESYADNVLEEADDFLDANETDYGKACLVSDYLGVVSVGDDTGLVLGDEPMLTTVFHSKEGIPIIARWVYGDDNKSVDHYLREMHLASLKNWQSSLSLKFSSNIQYLFDSACCASTLEKDSDDYLQLNIREGDYHIATSIYLPDETTKLIIHKFEFFEST